MTRVPTEPSTSPAILGLDNVRLDLPVAGVANRALAAFVDYLVLVLSSMLLSMAVLIGLRLLGVASHTVMAILIAMNFLLNWWFFAAVEIAMGGQTIGKRLLHLRVVTRLGGSPSVLALIVRNLLRVIDLLVGVFLIALDTRARRLGDLLAGTLVIREAGTGQETAVSRIPQGWGAREVAMVESFLDRCETLEEGRRRHLAERILAWIERDDPTFLESVEQHPDPAARVRAALRPQQL